MSSTSNERAPNSRSQLPARPGHAEVFRLRDLLCRGLLLLKPLPDEVWREAFIVPLGGLAQSAKEVIKGARHEAEVVPVVLVVHIVVVTPHDGPRQRQYIRVDVQRPKGGGNLHAEHEEERDAVDEGAERERQPLRPPVLRRERKGGEGVQLVRLLIHVMLRMLHDELAQIKLMEEVVVVEEDHELDGEEVERALHERLGQTAAILPPARTGVHR